MPFSPIPFSHRFLKFQSSIYIPYCFGRYMVPGSLYRPHHERFDENCDPRPLPHPETSRFTNLAKSKSRANIADKKPFHFKCESNRVYWWCSCGHSRKQPFCDGHHIKILGSNPHFKINKPQFKPIRLIYEKSCEVWFCNCKQTKEPPYCDGSHNCTEVQSTFKY